jgi:hypothetical protein
MGVDLDRPREDDPFGTGQALMSGEEEFSLDLKMMSVAHHDAEEAVFGPIGGSKDGRRRQFSDGLDEEDFAAAWRPPTMADMLDEIILERIEAERRQRESEAPRPYPEPRAVVARTCGAARTTALVWLVKACRSCCP